MTRPALGLAAVLLCIAAAAMFVFAQAVKQNIASAAAQASQMSSITDPAHTIAQLQRPGVRVEILDRAELPPPPPGAPPPGAPPRGMRPPRPPAGPLGWLFRAFGVIPQRVIVGPDIVAIHPDEALAVQFFCVLIAALGVVFALSLFLLRNAAAAAERAAMQPLVKTTAALQALAEGDFTPHEIPTGEREDLSALATAYTRASRRVAQAIAEEAEARAQMRQFIGDAGHELRTPITIVNTYLDLLHQPHNDPDALAKITSGMRTEMKRMQRLVENLLSLTRMETATQRTQDVDAVALASEAVERLSRIAGSREISLSGPPSAPVNADARDIGDALGNLIENALKYGGASDVRVAIASTNSHVSIDIEDAGPGITQSDRERLFDRFFRGANAGGVDGSGLGLAIAKLGVERSGGTIRYEPLQPGSRFHIELPAASVQ